MSVACGTGFTYVVTENGEAWSTGHNNFGQLGHGYGGYVERDDVLQLQKVGFTSADPIVMIAAGGEHGALVTKDGQVCRWGLELVDSLDTETKKRSPVVVLFACISSTIRLLFLFVL